MDKWFCFVNIEEFDFCDLKCDPMESKRLQQEYEGITPGYHMNKHHWINIIPKAFA
ncbi:MmcQ/YjbR family DNA-binding protein [Mucilaginibacter pocheonensis]|uniref:MmcQ/YjbR family DNA-binding protein n=1 Tax=Mucilaginibacter pocheonensis TaxID=398050 RepID=UPI0035B52731